MKTERTSTKYFPSKKLSLNQNILSLSTLSKSPTKNILAEINKKQPLAFTQRPGRFNQKSHSLEYAKDFVLTDRSVQKQSSGQKLPWQGSGSFLRNDSLDTSKIDKSREYKPSYNKENNQTDMSIGDCSMLFNGSLEFNVVKFNKTRKRSKKTSLQSKVKTSAVMEKEIEQAVKQFCLKGQPKPINISQPELSRKSVVALKNQLTKEDFHVGKFLGEGNFGKVYVVKHKLTGFICAMKVVTKKTIKQEKMEAQVGRELKIMCYLRHSNINNMYGFFDDKENVYMLMQLCMEGMLYKKLKELRKLDEPTTAQYVQQVCNGMAYLHSKKILHRDIKPENIILHEVLLPLHFYLLQGVLKICDFGWAVYSPHEKRSTFCGTPLYLSPEIVQSKAYDQRTDVWAIGILTYQLLIGMIPFRIWSQAQLHKIVDQEITFPDWVPVSDTAKDFILSILKKNPSQRISIRKILEHPFLTKVPATQTKLDAHFLEE